LLLLSGTSYPLLQLPASAAPLCPDSFSSRAGQMGAGCSAEKWFPLRAMFGSN
jgi:hypothetical protein